VLKNGSKLEIWGKIQREAAQRCTSDCLNPRLLIRQAFDYNTTPSKNP